MGKRTTKSELEAFSSIFKMLGGGADKSFDENDAVFNEFLCLHDKIMRGDDGDLNVDIDIIDAIRNLIGEEEIAKFRSSLVRAAKPRH
jgi:hypothetical protein